MEASEVAALTIFAFEARDHRVVVVGDTQHVEVEVGEHRSQVTAAAATFGEEELEALLLHGIQRIPAAAHETVVA